eukprot:m.250774 g.250774  ORF g.250774 m.250774 type:complete len:191 (-) comp19101_c0_seq6:2357-2929(-)
MFPFGFYLRQRWKSSRRRTPRRNAGALVENAHPQGFTPPSSPSMAVKMLSDGGSARRRLRAGLQGQESFDELFLQLAQSALDNFSLCGRFRLALAAVCDMAALHFHRRDYEQAFHLFAKAAGRFRVEGWNAAACIARKNLAVCARSLGKDEEYANCCLHLIASTCLGLNEKVSVTAACATSLELGPHQRL